MALIDAIVPAYNEQSTIARVVAALVQSKQFRRVIVVDDGSTDATVSEATRAGAAVLRMPQNSGKGQAMLAGVRSTDAPFIAFFDADLLTLSPEHVLVLTAPINNGTALMTCGLRDYGTVYNRLQQFLPIITGERVVSRSILDHVPPEFWSGWKLEAAMNESAARLGAPVSLQVLHGLQMRPKWEKVGIKKGLEDASKMMIEVLIAMRDAKAHP